MIQVGNIAPDFTLSDQNGNQISLNQFIGKKIVLYFYPKDNTSGCSKEACSFRDEYETILDNDAVIIGVSPDSKSSHQKFIDKYSLNFSLLSDENKTMLSDYGVWKEKSMYGKKYMGVERTTLIIDASGVVRKIFNKVKVDGHTSEVIEELKKI